MKKFLTVFTILSLAVYSAGAANAANLLSNPDLDIVGVGDQTLATPINGWHVNSNRALTGAFTDGASSETFANLLQPGGFGLFFKAFQGDTGVVTSASSSKWQDNDEPLSKTLRVARARTR